MIQDKCLHMWSGLHISPEGYIHLCGISKEKLLEFTAPHINEVEDLQTFFNSDYFISYRKTAVANNKFCVACVKREKSGVSSARNLLPRTYELNDIKINSEIDKCLLEHLDVCFNNLCNQQCLMCKSEYSTKWYKEDKKLENTDFKRKPIKYKKWTSDQNILKVLNVLPNLKILTIKGGEPLIQEEVKVILRFIQENKLQTKVEILSNFQEVSPEMMHILQNLQNFSLRISLDASGLMYNWTRGGNWEKTTENIRTYAKGRAYFTDLAYTNTLNRWSYKSLIEDIKLVEKLNSEFCEAHNNYNLYLVMGPKYASPFAAPLEERLEFIDRFQIEFGKIKTNSMRYKSLNINHLYDIIALNQDSINEDKNLIDLSDSWAAIINMIRKE